MSIVRIRKQLKIRLLNKFIEKVAIFLNTAVFNSIIKIGYETLLTYIERHSSIPFIIPVVVDHIDHVRENAMLGSVFLLESVPTSNKLWTHVNSTNMEVSAT